VKLVNLTDHNIDIFLNDYGRKKTIIIPPSGQIARCEKRRMPAQKLFLPEEQENRFPVRINQVDFINIEGLPSPGDRELYHTIYIVSTMVARAARAKGREDVISPDFQMKDAMGRKIGCRAFASMSPLDLNSEQGEIE
jgi:hypothetical protein